MQPHDSPEHGRDCPSLEELTSYFLGLGSEDSFALLEQHLASCRRCCDALAAMDLARASGEWDTPTDSHQLRARAAVLKPSDTPAAVRRTAGAAAPPGDLPTLPEAAGVLPRLLGQYLLLEKLGQGGMGSVYKAEHTRLKRPVAIKMMRADRLHNPQIVTRFYREMEAVGNLDHPNLVRAFDANEVEGCHFLVMEFLDGTDLARVVERHGRLSLADACEVIRQAALGLQCVHEHGLVHRDVKPSNLFLTTRGQVKVVDLGLALLRPLPQAAGGERLTDSSQVLGTADYMAPEQGSRSSAVDIRADIYSLGCTLYKLLTGRAPFSDPECDSFFAKLLAHTQKPVPPLRDVRPDVPAALVAVLDRMLAKAPDDRFATPLEVAAALEEFAVGASLPALTRAPTSGPPFSGTPGTPVVPPPRPGFPRVRAWQVGAVAGLLVAVAIAAVVILRPGGGGATPTLPDPNPPTAPGQPSLAPDVWHDLLQPNPVLLRAPKDPPLVQFHEAGRELTVSATAFYLIRLGETTAADYEIEALLKQTPWTGAVGIFFGYHEEKDDQGIPAFRYQVVELVRDNPQQGRWRLERTLNTSKRIGNPLAPMRWDNSSPVSDAPVPEVLPRDHTLFLKVADNQVVRVAWDGTDLPNVATEKANERVRKADSVGSFGVCGSVSSTIFRRVRFLYTLRGADGQP